MLTDPIADMLTRIRNGGLARLVRVSLPGSRLKADIARVLKERGFISDFSREGDPQKPTLSVEIRYNASQERLYLDMGYGSDVLAENLSFGFTFLDISGNETANEDDIVRVQINVVAETEELNPLTDEVQSITLQSEVMLRSQTFDVFAN